MTNPISLGIAGVVVVIGGLMAFLMLLGGDTASAGTCGPTGPAVMVDPATLPAGSVGGYSGEQLTNAAYVMNAAQAMGLSVRAQTIGVMTAMGESSLKVLDRGDTVGPDSRGLFQQRANGAWGTYEDRMDPTISATNFFKALVQVPNWETLEPPTLAAHYTQRNADPDHYTPYWEPAVAVVEALAGAQFVQGVARGCSGTTSSAISASGWTHPTTGPLLSGFGPRDGRNHNGVDISPPCDTPIYAVTAGEVVGAGPSSGYGNLITIDHGGGVVTRYAHMFPDGLLVRVGKKVKTGEQIALVGTYGDSTGCHLHFEVMVDGAFTDPVPFMAASGIKLGAAAESSGNLAA